MKVSFRGNRLVTTLRVSSTIKDWSKDYADVEIDTGAWNTAIPERDIIPDPKFPVRMLKWNGTYKTRGLGFDGYLDSYEADLLIGSQDEVKKGTILATPDIQAHDKSTTYMQPVLGRESIHKYKWKIDHKANSVEATKYR